MSPRTLAVIAQLKAMTIASIATLAAITGTKLKAEKAEKAETAGLKQKAVPLRVAPATAPVGPGQCLSSEFTSSQVDATRSAYTRRMWDIQLLPMPGMLQQQPFKKTVCGAHEIFLHRYCLEFSTDASWISQTKVPQALFRHVSTVLQDGSLYSLLTNTTTNKHTHTHMLVLPLDQFTLWQGGRAATFRPETGVGKTTSG